MVRPTQRQSRARNRRLAGPAGPPKPSQVQEVLVTLRDRLEAQLENGADRGSVMVPDLRDHMREQLIQINAALVRIEEGKYGVCAHCRTVIAADRLIARPYSTLCGECQDGQEWGRLEPNEAIRPVQ
jgi:RNA polymerase-binding transcription factor DksA